MLSDLGVDYYDNAPCIELLTCQVSLKVVGEFSLICCTSISHAGNTKIWAKIISAYAKKCSITGFSSLMGGGGAKTQVYMPSRGMNA